MDAAQIADLLTQGIRGPVGPEDAGFHTGTVITWDEATQANSVYVNGTVLNNVRAIQSGIGVLYQAGDVVVLIRKQTQYFVLGKVSAPGGNNSNQIKSATISTFESTAATSFTDLATVGPSVTVTIGSSRRCLLITGAIIYCTGNPVGQFIGGSIGAQITGASAIGPAFGALQNAFSANATNGAGFQNYATRVSLVTAADGLNAGNNTFTCKYYSQLSSPTCGFSARNITVIPF